jgi:hypothetical protein
MAVGCCWPQLPAARDQGYPMPADVTRAAKRKRLREMVLYRKTAVSLEQLFDRMRAKIAQGERGELDQRPPLH